MGQPPSRHASTKDDQDSATPGAEAFASRDDICATQDDGSTTSAVNYNNRQTPSYAQSQYETVVRRQRIRSGSNPLKIPHRLLYPPVRHHPYLVVQDDSTPTTPSVGGEDELPRSRLDLQQHNESAPPARVFHDWEFSGWGSMSFESITDEEVRRARAERELKRQQAGEGSLGAWLGSGVAGVAVAGSPLYAFPALVSVAGVYSPISLFVATLLLSLWRPIMVELGQVIPLDGGNYVYLLNATSKSVAIVGAALTLLDDIATSIVSAGTAASYIAAEVGRQDAATAVWLTIILLIGLTLFGLAGIRGNAETTVVTLVFHLLTVAMVVVAAIVQWSRSGNQVISSNWNEYAPGSASPIWKQLFLGVCVAFLGVTGIESAPDYRSSVREGAYPTVLKSLQWIAISINAPLMLVTFGVLPMSQILGNQSVVRTVADVSAGKWLRIWTSIDSVIILGSTVLTGLISSNSLVVKLAGDSVLPSLFAKRLAKTGAPFVALTFFGVASIVIYASTGCDLAIMSSIFAIVFLSIMCMFPITCLLLSYYRPRLPRPVSPASLSSSSTFSLSIFVLVLSLVLIIGNVVASPIILAYLVAYTVVLTVIMTCVSRRNKLLQILFWTVEQTRWTRGKKGLREVIAKSIKVTRTGPVVLFVDGDEIHRLAEMLIYVKQNEETNLVKVVHCFKTAEEIPSELEANCKILDEAFPSITVDLVFIQTDEFSPLIVDAYASRLGIDNSKCLMGSLSCQSRFSLKEFGGVRVVAGCDFGIGSSSRLSSITDFESRAGGRETRDELVRQVTPLRERRLETRSMATTAHVNRSNLRASFDSSDPIVRAEAVRFRAEQERLERQQRERKAVKLGLLKWWKQFTRKHGWSRPSTSSVTHPKTPLTASNPTTTAAKYQVPGRGLQRGQSGKDKVFGVSPQQSLKYASVAIRLVASDGKPYVYGYVPIVVAKCGMWLKENATHTQGIFRVSGSNKRINQLQTLFDSPPTYGRDLDWNGYSVHDAASVLRRYLNQMPEPVIPAELYLDFTAVLQRNLPEHEAVDEYKKLIGLLPAPSRYLLLYLLDFLAVFVRYSTFNLMTASNLATVFQPGLVSTRRESGNGEVHGAGGTALLGFPGFGADGQIVDSRRGSQPAWVQKPSTSTTTAADETNAVGGVGGGGASQKAREGAGEHGKGKEVLEFLIEQQSHFMLGLQPPIKEAAATTTSGSEGKNKSTSTKRRVNKREQDNEETSGGHKDAAEDSGYGQSSPSESGRLTQMVSRTTTEGGGSNLGVPSVLNALPPATRLASLSPGELVASTSSGRPNPPSLAAELAAIGGTGSSSPSTGLMRKGSEKSVERRRLRKNQEESKNASGAGVRRSKTVPSRGSSRSSTPAVPSTEGTSTPPGLADSPRKGSPNPNAPTTLKPTRSMRKHHHLKSDLPTVPASPDRSAVAQRSSAKRDDSSSTMHTARTSASTGADPPVPAANLLERSTSTKSRGGRSKVKADKSTSSPKPDSPSPPGGGGPVETLTKGGPLLQPK
ncbi:hypothetical protein ACM66B_003985 [Microbotryomycetes sp. NB124-2]